jgi:hypothetical protein
MIVDYSCPDSVVASKRFLWTLRNQTFLLAASIRACAYPKLLIEVIFKLWTGFPADSIGRVGFFKYGDPFLFCYVKHMQII